MIIYLSRYQHFIAALALSLTYYPCPLRALVTTFLFMLGIEYFQKITGTGVFDLVDVRQNLTGALVGSLILLGLSY